MNKLTTLISCLALAGAAAAQSVAIYPNEYVAVPDGPLNSANLPLARGVSRVMCLYEDVDLDVPHGNTITKLGFREDAGSTQLAPGRLLQMEVRMGWTTEDHLTMSTTFDSNYDGAFTSVFGPAVYTLPNLQDASAPLTNGQFFIDLSTPFVYQPNGRNLIVEYRIFGTSMGGSPFTYRIDRADFFSPRTYGPAGCMHSSGQAANLLLFATRPGLNFQASVSAAPGNSPAFLAINLGNSIVPPYDLSVILGLDPACTGQMNGAGLAFLGGTTSSSGSKSWVFPIPNDNTFGDVAISAQGIFLDFFAPGGLVTSNGGEVLTGIRSRTSIISANGAPTTATVGSKSSFYCPVAFFEHQ